MLKLSSDYLKHYNVKAAGESSVNSDPRCKSMRCLVVSLAFLATCFAYFHSNRVSSPLSGGLRLLSGTRFSVQPLVLAAAAGPSRKNPELMETVDHLLDDQQQLIMIDSNDAGSSATEVMESSTKLLPASALEISFDNSIVFGNYLEKKANSNAIRVNFASGAEAWIDCSQIVSVWDTLSDEPPMNAAEWAKTLVQAELLLNQSVPRKTNLDEFWYLVRQQRSSALPIDSQDVGVYLFQESKFSSWKDPTLEAEAAKVRPLTAAQRTAAAMLLHFDGAMHFKRRPSWIAEVSADVSLTEGGYKIVDESIVCFKECEMFVQYFNDRATLQDSGSIADDVRQDSPVIRRLLRQLELYALCSSNTVRPSSSLTNNRQQGTIAAAPKVVKMILKKLGLPVTPLSARDILLKIGQRNSSVYKPLHSDLKRVMSFDTVAANDENNKHKDSVKEKNTEGVPYTLNLTPWSAVVMKEAAALQADVEAQRKKMDETGNYI